MDRKNWELPWLINWCFAKSSDISMLRMSILDLYYQTNTYDLNFSQTKIH